MNGARIEIIVMKMATRETNCLDLLLKAGTCDDNVVLYLIMFLELFQHTEVAAY